MNRRDCLAWLASRGWTAPRSACIGCPFHSDDEWRRIREVPEEWADAIEVDRTIRHQPGMRGEQFMHSQRVPLDQVDLSTPADRGQADLFGNECERMCGV
jgi:hypothetical protein